MELYSITNSKHSQIAPSAEFGGNELHSVSAVQAREKFMEGWAIFSYFIQ